MLFFLYPFLEKKLSSSNSGNLTLIYSTNAIVSLVRGTVLKIFLRFFKLEILCLDILILLSNSFTKSIISEYDCQSLLRLYFGGLLNNPFIKFLTANSIKLLYLLPLDTLVPLL